jgi:hypothetical protein
MVASAYTQTVAFDRNDTTIDSFERQRNSLPSIVFEQNFSQAPANPIFEQGAYGSGTLSNTANSGTTSLNTVATTTGNGYWIQSYQYVRYAPGISTLQRFTFTFAPLTANLTQRVGMYSDQAATGSAPSGIGDGLFLEAAGATINLVLRNYIGGAVNEIRIPQSQWNMDRLDGSGPAAGNPSNVNINWAVPQHFTMAFQYLGVGNIMMGFNTNFGLIWAHKLTSVNVLATPYARTGSFPIRAEIFTTGTIPSAASLQLINMTVIQETDGSRKRGWRYFSGNSGTTASAIGTANALYPLLAMRALLTNDLTKRATFLPVRVGVTVAAIGTGNTAIQWAIIAMPTPLTGATFGITPAPSSVIEFDTAATETTAVTGEIIYSGTLPNVVGQYDIDLSNFDDNQIRAGQNAAGNLTITGQNVLCLAVGSLQGTCTVAPSIAASIIWKEIY